MSRETYEAAKAAFDAKPAPWPPRELRQCQDLLRGVSALLQEWTALGKGDGVHGQQLRAVLERRPG